MKKLTLLSICILICFQIIGQTIAKPTSLVATKSLSPVKKQLNDWVLKKAENGINVYTRTAENSKFNELKVVFQVNTSLSSIVALLNDVEAYPKWIYHCEEAKILKKNSDKHLIRYQKTAAPWPVDSRDLAVEVNTYQDDKTKIVYQKINAVPDYTPIAEDYVRVREFKALWTLKPLKNGVVQVEYELIANPAGNIPSWLVNLAVVEGPYETSINMKKRLLDAKYQKANVAFIINPE